MQIYKTYGWERQTPTNFVRVVVLVDERREKGKEASVITNIFISLNKRGPEEKLAKCKHLFHLVGIYNNDKYEYVFKST